MERERLTVVVVCMCKTRGSNLEGLDHCLGLQLKLSLPLQMTFQLQIYGHLWHWSRSHCSGFKWTFLREHVQASSLYRFRSVLSLWEPFRTWIGSGQSYTQSNLCDVLYCITSSLFVSVTWVDPSEPAISPDHMLHDNHYRTERATWNKECEVQEECVAALCDCGSLLIGGASCCCQCWCSLSASLFGLTAI